MKIGNKFREEMEPMPMAPLLDIVFIILLFFMIVSAYSSIESEVDITLPTADSAVQTERTQGEIFINLKSDGTIVVNDRAMDLAELQGVLERVAEYFPGGAVVIRGDNQAMLGRAIEVLDACRKADIQNVSFAVVEAAPQPAAAPESS
jgi:biopolymer transport protein ExbD